MPKDILEHVGACVLQARKRKKLSRRKLSEITGLAEKTIQQIEKGETNASCETLFLLVNELQIPVGCLFDLTKSNNDIEVEHVVSVLRTCTDSECRFVYNTVLEMVDGLKELRKQ